MYEALGTKDHQLRPLLLSLFSLFPHSSEQRTLNPKSLKDLAFFFFCRFPLLTRSDDVRKRVGKVVPLKLMEMKKITDGFSNIEDFVSNIWS